MLPFRISFTNYSLIIFRNDILKSLESPSTLTLEKFVSFMKKSCITLFDSGLYFLFLINTFLVIVDIESGIKLAILSSQLNSTPISMVLDGKALSCLFPPPRSSPASALPPSTDNVKFNPDDFIVVQEDHLQNNISKVEGDLSFRNRDRNVSYTLNSNQIQADSIKDLVILSNTEQTHIESFPSSLNRLVSLDITSVDSEMVNEVALQNGRDLFFNLTKLCKSVIACRLTPDQKALIVTETRKRQGVLTLAIGDGISTFKIL